MKTNNSQPSFATYAGRILQLKCPRCGSGRLFSSWFRMSESCSACELDLVREPGFYLGSIYFNYGMTVALVTPTFVILTLGFGYSRDAVIWPSALFSILFPLWFYRYARSMWLSIMFRVSSVDFTKRQSQQSELSGVEVASQSSVVSVTDRRVSKSSNASI